jgi:hypothetical protein
MNRNCIKFRIGIELFVVALNAALAFCLYLGNTFLSYSPYKRTILAVVADRSFLLGLIAMIAVVCLRRSLRGFLTRFSLLILITVFNQLCMTAFFLSLLPIPIGNYIIQTPSH